MQRMKHGRWAAATLLAGLTAGSTDARGQTYPGGSEINKSGLDLHIENYAVVPKTGASNTTYVARVNFLRSEPAAAPGSGTRYFTVDNNGNLYTLDKSTRSFDSIPGGAVDPYVSFPSQFTRFDNNPGFAAGAVTFQFDPEYAIPGPNFGKFYTTHTERLDDNPNSEYRRAVLTAWQDTNISDNVFSGTKRQLLTADYQNNIHPMGDITFNPNATPGHADYRNMYISSGDGGAGETTAGRTHPQDLTNIIGKVLRIQPDGAGPGQYTIPADNPFVGTAGARGEIWANGFRNPHRMYWDAPTDKLIVNDIGFHRWEEVNFVRRGGNYGYSDIEGDMFMSVPSGNVTPIPGGTLTPQFTFPAAAYSHQDGDAISSGFVYRGTKVPVLAGKYIFGDITTGRIFYCDYAEMMAMEADGNRHSQAAIHEFQIVFNGVDRELFDIVRDEFDIRGDGIDDNDQLPGGGRADIRPAMGLDGELYILSKSDGMIRAIVPEPTSAVALVTFSLFCLQRRARRR